MLTFEATAIQGSTSIVEKLSVYDSDTAYDTFRLLVAVTTFPKGATSCRYSGCATVKRAGRDSGYGHRGSFGGLLN